MDLLGLLNWAFRLLGLLGHFICYRTSWVFRLLRLLGLFVGYDFLSFSFVGLLGRFVC